jgi:hypothetical protein
MIPYCHGVVANVVEAFDIRSRFEEVGLGPASIYITRIQHQNVLALAPYAFDNCCPGGKSADIRCRVFEELYRVPMGIIGVKNNEVMDLSVAFAIRVLDRRAGEQKPSKDNRAGLKKSF